MKTTFCRVNTIDKLRLDGLLFAPDPGPQIGILHLPGRAGNFYANGFFEAMVKIYTDAGFGFLSVNLRGHDQVADFRVGDTDRIRRIGQAFDVFEECAIDIEAWLEFFRARGYKKIILQGHSQGGGKAVYFLNQKPQADVVALVLMSPADASGLLKKYSAKDFENNMAEAKKLLARGRGGELLTQTIRGYYVSAKSFSDEFSDESAAKIFPIFENGEFEKLESVRVPVLAFYGSKEDTIINSAKGDLETIGKHLRCPGSKTFIIDGADHTYHGYEKQMAAAVAGWIGEISGINIKK